MILLTDKSRWADLKKLAPRGCVNGQLSEDGIHVQMLNWPMDCDSRLLWRIIAKLDPREQKANSYLPTRQKKAKEKNTKRHACDVLLGETATSICASLKRLALSLLHSDAAKPEVILNYIIYYYVLL
jgi:hypothetical protein